MCARVRALRAWCVGHRHIAYVNVCAHQDFCMAEKKNVNAAMTLDVGAGVVQTSAARPGMMVKDSFDEKSLRWRFDNPLRVRDVSFAVKEVVVEGDDGRREGTSHIQLRWRRLKRRYWEVYFFRSAITANDQEAVRRVTVRLRAFMIRTARFRACRRGLSPEQVHGSDRIVR